MSRKFLTGIDVASQAITSVASPSNPTDAANKNYVDNAIAGQSWKQPVRVATTVNGTLATAFANGQTVDGVTLTTAMRILLKNQTTATDNGIYTVNASGAPTRATDADSTSELQNAAVYIIAGTVNADTAYVQTANDPVIGTTGLVFAQIGGTGISYTAGNGLALTSTTFSVTPKTGGGLTVDGTGVSIDRTQSGSKVGYAADVPSGSTTATITHSLGTLDVIVQVYDKVSGAQVELDVVLTSTSVVTLTSSASITTGQYRVVILPV